MNRVQIARLKARLSEYLREVRHGHGLVVLDRETPIARLVPYHDIDEPLRVRQPRPRSPSPGRVRLPPPLKLPVDAVRILLEERQPER